MKIHIVKPGLFTTMQDGGRIGVEAYGIPQNGFLDTIAATNANRLVGNNDNSALVEITGTGPTLQFDEACAIAICGAELSPCINSKEIKNNTAISIKKNDTLSFGRLKKGYRCYVAINGSFLLDDCYGSKATNTIAQFGGFKGRALQKNDVLELQINTNKNPKTALLHYQLPISPAIIQLQPGPEIELFSRNEINRFMTSRFTVSKDSNRMGIRLEGNWLDGKKLETIISSGNVLGVIQITPSLQPIILLNDAGTTGGYPRIGICASKSLSALAQLKPGDTVEFSF